MMELQNLSSNWEKLKQSLYKDSDNKPPKRKAPADSELSSSKRRKPTTKTDTREPKSKTASPLLKIPGTKSAKSKASSHPPQMGNLASRLPSLAIWARENDIPTSSLRAAYPTPLPPAPAVSINAGLSQGLTPGKYVALDCEMVGVGPPPHSDSALARVSLVDYNGAQLYDSFVLPKEPVTDYRTHVSGITPALLRGARRLEDVQRDVAALLDGRILVGHAVRHDLDALMLGHPKRDVRDTSRYFPYRAYARGRTPALKKLALEVLGIEIQGGEHSSIEDARATMLLFRREKEGFEREHVRRWGVDRRGGGDENARAGEKRVRKGKRGGKKKKTKK